MERTPMPHHVKNTLTLAIESMANSRFDQTQSFMHLMWNANSMKVVVIL